MAAVTVTALARKPRSKRFELHLDGAPAFPVTPDIAVRFALRPGTALSPERLEQLRDAIAREDAMTAGLRLVARRPRSIKELRDALRRRGVEPEIIDATAARLRELGLLDDSSFAASWVESRGRSAPRGRRMLVAELREKGIGRTPAEEAVRDLDEAEAAYRAGAKRARALAGKPFEEFRRKVGDLLLRRGFGYEIASETAKRLWEESGGEASPVGE